MKTLLSTLLLPVLFLPSSMPAGGATEADELVSVGEPFPAFHFKNLLRGDGRDRLSQFRGQPVLLAWCSTVFAGMEAAKVSVKAERDFADWGLVPILMEIKRHDETYIEALALTEIPGSTCRLMKTHKLGIAWEKKRGLPPYVALIGVDGTLLYAGSYQSFSTVKKLLKKEVARLRKGWGDDRTARKARALAYGKRELGRAHTLLQEALREDAANEELTELCAELVARYESTTKAVSFLIEDGRPREAREVAERLADSVADHPTWAPEVVELQQRFATERLLTELALEKKLDKLLEPIQARAPREGLAEKVSRFAEEASGSRVGVRAERLARVIDFAVKEKLKVER